MHGGQIHNHLEVIENMFQGHFFRSFYPPTAKEGNTIYSRISEGSNFNNLQAHENYESPRAEGISRTKMAAYRTRQKVGGTVTTDHKHLQRESRFQHRFAVVLQDFATLL